MLVVALLILLSVAHGHELSDAELHNKFDQLKQEFLDEDGNPVLKKRHELSDAELHNKFDQLKQKYLDEDGNPVLLKRHLGATLALTLRSKVTEEERYEIFANESDYVEKHNKEAGVEWQAGYNEFSILTEEEKTHFLGLNSSSLDDMVEAEKRTTADEVRFARRLDKSTGDFNVNYTDKLPSPRSQGGCESCWAFAQIAALEYQVNKNSSTVIALSDQHALDCSTSGDYDGCSGGGVQAVFKWLMDKSKGNSSLAMREDYPYSPPGKECPSVEGYRDGFEGFGMWGIRQLISSDEAMAKAMEDPEVGAVTVSLGVYHSFFSYKSGVYYSAVEDCTPANHAVTLVGYGVEGGIPFFTIRNSWGANWGVNGHAKVKRGLNGENLNTCKLSAGARYPLVYKDPYSGAVTWCRYESAYISGDNAKYRDRTSDFDSFEDAKEACIMTETCTGIQHEAGTYTLRTGNFVRDDDEKYTSYVLCGGWTERAARLEERTDPPSTVEPPYDALGYKWCFHKHKWLFGKVKYRGKTYWESLTAAKRACMLVSNCKGVTGEYNKDRYSLRKTATLRDAYGWAHSWKVCGEPEDGAVWEETPEPEQL